MKKVLLMIAIALGCTTAFAQNLDKNEAKQLKAFLTQTSEKGGTNAQELKVTNLNSLASVEGVTVVGGHVTAIEWKDKHLAGELSLSGFPALTKIDVSRNKITSLSVANAPALTELNAARNVLSSFQIDACPAITKLTLYKNRLSEVNLGESVFQNSPQLKNLNVSNNPLM